MGVKRLAVSMLIAARSNGFRAKEQDRIVLDTVGRYRTAMADFAGMKNLECGTPIWISRACSRTTLRSSSPRR